MAEKHNPQVAPSVLSVVTGIDLKTTGTTSLYTVPAGRKALITDLIIHLTTGTSVSVVASISLGTNSTDFNNIFAIYALTNLDTTDEFNKNSPIVAVASAAASVVTLNVTTGATATTATARAVLIGVLV